MLESVSGDTLSALARWLGQVLALKLSAAHVSCSCPPWPGSPAHNFTCNCHGGPLPAVGAGHGTAAVLSAAFAAGLLCGLLLALLASCCLSLVRRSGSAARRAFPGASELDERERVQQELRRLRK